MKNFTIYKKHKFVFFVEGGLMKKFKVCIESYPSNNSDLKQYENYIIESNNIENAKEYAKICIANWNKVGKGITYNIFDLWEVLK